MIEPTKIEHARLRALLAEIESLMLELTLELEDLASGRRRTTTNAVSQSVAIGLRVRVAQRSARTLLGHVDAVEREWLTLLPTIDRYYALDVSSR